MIPAMINPEAIISFPAQKRYAPRRIHFSKRELFRILDVYGRMVAAGIWRDYAIDDTVERGGASVAFCVFRRTSEGPAYRIIKEPRLARRQGAYRVLDRQGRILKRGASLEAILSIFDSKMLRLVK